MVVKIVKSGIRSRGFVTNVIKLKIFFSFSTLIPLVIRVIDKNNEPKPIISLPIFFTVCFFANKNIIAPTKVKTLKICTTLTEPKDTRIMVSELPILKPRIKGIVCAKAIIPASQRATVIAIDAVEL